MKKRIVYLAVIVIALCISCGLVACNGGNNNAKKNVVIATSTGTVLCSISTEGNVSTERIVIEQNGLNVYSWVAKVDGENVRVIDNEELVMDGEVYVASRINEERLTVYPEKYYTNVNVSGSASIKAIIGEVPTALPVPQKGYAEFIGYYYLNENDEKVMVTNENGNFFLPWSANLKNVDLMADFDMTPIGVELSYGLEDVNDKNESSIPDYIYYGDPLTFAFPQPKAQGRYDFEGWYSEETAGVKIVDDKGSYVINSFKSDTAKNLRFYITKTEEGAKYPYVVTFFARWKAASHRVDYYDGDEIINSLNISYGETVPNLDAPAAPAGKQFAYWYQGSDDSTPFDFSLAKMGVYDMVLRCKWKDAFGVCSYCGQTIDADKFPVCVSILCPNCGEVYRGPVAPHSFEDESVVNAAVCGADGVGRKVCSVCGEVENYAIPALQHEYVFKEKVPATCSQQGYIAYECVNCHNVDYRYEDVVVEHKFNTSRVEATEYELGYTSNKCIYCRAFVNKYFDSKGNSYITITNKEELYAAAKTSNANYVLMNDIRLYGEIWTPWGLNEDGSVTPFEGIFNGNGYVIDDYKINQTPYGEYAYGSSELSVGFFAELKGTVINLNLRGALNCDPLYADNIYVGGLAGKTYETSLIKGVNVVGSISVNNNAVSYGGDLTFGGLVGLAAGRIEDSSFVTGMVGGYDAISVCGYNYTVVGGLAGELAEKSFIFTSTVRFDTAFSAISKVASVTAGGVVGLNRGFVDLTAASGYLNANAALESFVGGLIGENQGVAYKSMASVSLDSRGADDKQSFSAYTIAMNNGIVYKLSANRDAGTLRDSAENVVLMSFSDMVGNLDATFGVDYVLFDVENDRMPTPKSYVSYLQETDVEYVLDLNYYQRDEYGLADFNLSDILEKMEGSLRKFKLNGSYDLKYGNTYMPLCATVKGVDYFFGSFDGQGNKIRKFIFEEGYTSLFKHNYGTVKNLNLTFYYHKTNYKELPSAYLMGVVEDNKGVVDGCYADGNYMIRMKKGLQIFLGIFATLIFLVIIFTIESYYNADYDVAPFSYVAAILALLVVGLSLFLALYYGSTRLAVFMAITAAAMSLWPSIHTTHNVVDNYDSLGIPVMLLHYLSVLGGAAVAVVCLTIL